jgi:hypothetical protein
LAANGAEEYISEASQETGFITAVHQLDGYLAYEPRKRGFLFDIAIIEVYPPFELNAYKIPAKLPTARTPPGTDLIVSGWGDTSFGKLNTTLKFNITQVWCRLFSLMYFTNITIKNSFLGGRPSCKLRQLLIPSVDKSICNIYYGRAIRC